ncbi:MAG: hypothetical protein NXH88_19155 [Hyphomonas sp.]|nr:hypothetical protein [Hyphomonas sp.]
MATLESDYARAIGAKSQIRTKSGDVTFDTLNHGFDLLSSGKVVRQTLRPHLAA